MNKKGLILIGALIICLIFTSCSKDVAKDETASAPEMMSQSISMTEEDGELYYGDEDNGDNTSNSTDEVTDYSEKIIYNVNMGIIVDDPVEVSNQIKEKVSVMGGYVSSSYSNKNSDNASYVNMQVHVPSKGLNDMTDYISTISEVEYENMYTDNVTIDYYDMVTRLEHEKLQEEQYEKLMEEAETIEDILAVSERLSQVQQNIEVYEGRIRMWDSLVDYSTIDISISPTPTIDNNSGLIRVITLGETGRAIVRALDNSWRFIANFFSWLVRILAALLLPAAIVVPIVVIIVKAVKRNKKKRDDS